MSAANDFLNKRPYVTVVLSILSSLIVAFTVRSANIRKADLDSKASTEEVKTMINPIIQDVDDLKKTDLKIEADFKAADKQLKEDFIQQVEWLREDIKEYSKKQNKS